jgi:hypothetical protein
MMSALPLCARERWTLEISSKSRREIAAARRRITGVW